jgi:hypothetical protein
MLAEAAGGGGRGVLSFREELLPTPMFSLSGALINFRRLGGFARPRLFRTRAGFSLLVNTDEGTEMQRKPRLHCRGLHNGCPKMQVVVQKSTSKPPFAFKAYISKRPNGRRMPAEQQGKAAMKRCALCHRKLGLRVRFRNVWNAVWVHVRFCSIPCKAISDAKRNDAAVGRLS